MSKIFLTSAILATMVFPTFADNITTTNNDCDNTTLTTYSGSAVLEADWSPNTVNVTYYNGENVYGNGGQCTYDSTLTLPNNPSKTGYTFAGWRVKAANTAIDLSLFIPNVNLDYNEGNEDEEWDEEQGYEPFDYYFHRSLSYSLNGEKCSGLDEIVGFDNVEGETFYPVSNTFSNCSSDEFSNLNPGEWVYSQLASNDITSADIIKGISLCSDTNPITDGTSARNPKNGFAAIGSPSESGTRYCWCKGIERKNYNDNNFQSMAVNYWTATGTSPSNCERDCAESCVYWLRWADGWWDNDGFYNKILGNF